MSDSRGEKRPLVQQNSILEGVKAVLLDLEGVSAPTSYINEGFVMYMKAHLKSFLEKHYEDEVVKTSIDALRKANDKIPESSDKSGVVSSVFDLLTAGQVVDEEVVVDESHSSLLEAFWTEAYKEEIQGDLYEDVVPLIKILSSGDIKVYSFSLSPPSLQKLFFTHSNQGNVVELYSDFLVLKKKRDSDDVGEELKCVVKDKLKLALSDVLYLTHSFEASKKAGEVGMKSCFVLREVGDDVTEEQLQTVHVVSNLDELTEDDFDDDDDDDDGPPSKRRCDDDNDDDDDDDDNEDDDDGDEEEEEEEEE